MSSLRWILLIAGVVLLLGIFAAGRGWFKGLARRKAERIPADDGGSVAEADAAATDGVPGGQGGSLPAEPAVPVLTPASKLVAVRILPRPGLQFPAEQLVLALRAAGLRHGQYGIFHYHDDGPEARVRFSVASLVEPGSFDLTNLKESRYSGVSIFAVFPAADSGVELFDEMVAKAREICKAVDGLLADEQGGPLSLQRERYMREDLIDYLRRAEVDGAVVDGRSATA
jgi:cell division protein ZipA